jgi:hypothetical protein
MGKGNVFPLLKAESLDGKSLTIPLDTKGKYSLLGLASSQKAQEDLKTWLQPVYETFIAKSSKPALFEDSYDIHLYLVLMFTGSNEGMVGAAKKKMQQELDPELKPHVLLYKGEVSKYNQELQMTDKDKPYFFLLDEEGKIVHTISGVYTDAKMEKLEELLSEE